MTGNSVSHRRAPSLRVVIKRSLIPILFFPPQWCLSAGATGQKPPTYKKVLKEDGAFYNSFTPKRHLAWRTQPSTWQMEVLSQQIQSKVKPNIISFLLLFRDHCSISRPFSLSFHGLSLASASGCCPLWLCLLTEGFTKLLDLSL